jgi:hypothetical protein
MTEHARPQHERKNMLVIVTKTAQATHVLLCAVAAPYCSP